jgi:integrase
MASIIKKSKGWEVQISVKGARKTRTLPSKKLAEDWAFKTEYELRSQVEDGVSQTHTFRDVFERYQEEVSEHKKGSRWEIIRLTKFCTYPLADIKLSKLRREDLEAWIDLRLRTVKTSTVNRELNLISHCLTQARRWRWMKDNPMKDLKRPENPPHRDRRISQEEIDLVLHCLNYTEDHELDQKQQFTAAAFLFAIETAMRAKEICSLSPSTVDLDKRVAHLPKTKNGAARSVPLTREAVRLLKRVDCNFKLSPGVLSSSFLKAVRRSQIHDLTFHDSRHEGITRLSKKLGVLELARAVGHRDIKQLQTYYNESAEDLAKLL